MQAALPEAPARAAGAEVVAAEFLDEQLVAVNDPHAPFDVGLGREAAAALAHWFEKKACSSKSSCSLCRMGHLLLVWGSPHGHGWRQAGSRHLQLQNGISS